MDDKQKFNIDIMVSQYARRLSKDDVICSPDVWDEEHLDYNICRIYKVKEALQRLLDTKGQVKLNEAYELLGLPPEPTYDECVVPFSEKKMFIGWDYSVNGTVQMYVWPNYKLNSIIVDFNVVCVDLKEE